MPKVRVALVLGTSSKRANGDDNMYFNNRIKAAYDLYYYGRIQKMILSGDNSKDYYNEPKVMRKALMDMGVPDSVIVLDYAGLRTFDSMVRAKKFLVWTPLWWCRNDFIMSAPFLLDERTVLLHTDIMPAM
ncbi:MAG: YdcF family protein [Sphingobacteriaceae bacterium]|nr:YdcF family protein [Sphingobacteriaceae bacterium]